MDPDIIARVAERKIQEAIDEGKFDNLPGKGKPIVFDDDPMTPAHLRMANRILKNANVLPEWVQMQKELEKEKGEIAVYRETIVSQNHKRRILLEHPIAKDSDRDAFGVWHAKARAEYGKKLKTVNTLILKLSLIAPSTVAPMKSYKIEAEMKAFDTDFPPLTGQEIREISADNESTLKALARERYQESGGGTVRSWVAASRSDGKGKPERVSGFDAEDIGRADAPNGNE